MSSRLRLERSVPLLGDEAVARDAGVDEQQLVEEQHVGHGVEEVEEAGEHVDGQQADMLLMASAGRTPP
jgi:nucleotide-binding universal stress UspA family protein